MINEHLSKDDVTNDFRLAFFTIQNNNFYTYRSTSGMWYGQFDRYCLLENTDDFKKYYALRGENNENNGYDYKNNWSYSKELLIKLAEKSANEIIDDFKTNYKFEDIDKWIQLLITKPKLLDVSNRHYVCYYKKTKEWYLIKWNTYVTSDNWDGLKKIK
ncbi:hypothetical protein FACS1894162_7040 [Bacteroidia bacterium]|nr:hypothetical protein FACS1894162_7040 [Bacteroidia bacterium]